MCLHRMEQDIGVDQEVALEFAFAPRFIQGYGEDMTLEAIKEAVAGLPEDERHSLAAWLNELDYDEWDKQMVKDFSPGGRGMAWAERVKREIAEGKARPMEEGLAEAKAKREQPLSRP